jgi:hypothetical protein
MPKTVEAARDWTIHPDARGWHAWNGRTLARRRQYDPRHVRGIVHMKFPDPVRGHYVLVCGGVVLDPADAHVWRWTDYLAAKGCRPGSLIGPAGYGGEILFDPNGNR